MASHFGINLPFSEDVCADYISRAKDYAMTNGLVMRRRDEPGNDDVTSHVPLTLLPSPFPADEFSELTEIQLPYIELYHRLAHDFHFMETHLKPLAEVDDFVERLWSIYEQVKNRPKEEHRCLCLARNDFMLDVSTSSPVAKQIEINTIAASFGGLGTRLRGYHAHLLRVMGCGDQSQSLPESKLDENFADAMIECWKIYNCKTAVIMFIVEEVNRNIYDQRFLEHAIYRRSAELKVVWKTFKQLDNDAKLTEDNRLIVDGHEVALVYFRTGYVPDLYEGELGWRVRLLMEKSRAFMCPCIHTHLVGSKKVQQILCLPGILEKYVTNNKMAARIRRTFAGQYLTDQTPDGDTAVELALKNPEKYVLKTQREGGGNNIYGSAIVDELTRLSESSERGKYILMERIFPPKHRNYILAPEGGATWGNTISELGMYASSLWNGGEVTNKYCGQIYRTKLDGKDEGGVMVGIATIDSILLV